MLRQDLEPNSLIKRYVIAVTLLVGLVLGGHGLHLYIAKQGVLDEEVINISGSQRMLSQRIQLLAFRYADTGNPIYSDLLSDSIELFSANNQWLIDNAVTDGTDIYGQYIGDMGARLDVRSRDFSRLAQSIMGDALGLDERHAIAVRLEAVALNSLLSDLDEAVKLFEIAANQRAANLELVQLAALVAALIVLLLEVALIFYPAHKSLLEMITQLRFQAWHDAMTGLSNRPRFFARSKEIIQSVPDGLDRTLVLALDLDGFKEINDSLGHPVGDQVLIWVAGILKDTVSSESRLGDYEVARAGGDEFFICASVPDADVELVALELSEKLIRRVAVPMPVQVGENQEQHCSVGLSIGYSVGTQSNGNIDFFLGNADLALYVSKRDGKGIATGFRKSMRETAERRHQLMTEFKTGLKQFEFQAYFQPQIELATGRVLGLEALARWNHPERGLISHGEFNELAQEARLSDVLDGQIILDAIAGLKTCRANGHSIGHVAINASGMVLQNPQFCNLLDELIRAHSLRPKDFVIEILERDLVQEKSDTAVETVHKLVKAGFGVAIDDFGSGYSSLATVSQLGVTMIKLDESLVNNIETAHMQKILKAAIAMAQGINATVCGEAVETQKQYDILAAMDVKAAQGFLISPPLPLEKLNIWLDTKRSTDTEDPHKGGQIVHFSNRNAS